MKTVKRIYRKMITTEPVVYLDIFKAIVLVGSTLGFFTIDDSRLASLTAALGVLITAALSMLNRDAVYSQATVDKITSSTIEKNPPSITP